MIVCLTGMHRSGTSLMGNFFHQGGISMGSELVGAAPGNRFGHFEDIDFVDFHQRLLQKNGCHMYAPKTQLTIGEEDRAAAAAMLRQRSATCENWGWKDPRSCLFLDLWHGTSPDIRYVFLYRDPMGVIDSLLRRATDRRLRLIPWLAAGAWLRYNQDLLKFVYKTPGQCFLINIGAFNADTQPSLRLLEDWLQFHFKTPYEAVYDRKEIRHAPSEQNPLIQKLLQTVYGKRLQATYTELESVAHIRRT